MSKSQNRKLHRSIVDKIISWNGLVVSVALILVSFGLFWAQSFINNQVAEQLSMQNIVFPDDGSKEIESLPKESQVAVSEYAGQTMTSGEQAKVFADDYIAVHLRQIGDGQTYAELSEKANKNPDDAELSAKVDTMFRGETLRGMLLNAYAFGIMATVALYSAWVALVFGVTMLILSILGFDHARKVS